MSSRNGITEAFVSSSSINVHAKPIAAASICSRSGAFSSSLTPWYKRFPRQIFLSSQSHTSTPTITNIFDNSQVATTDRYYGQIVGQLSSPSTQIGRPKTSIQKDIGRVTQQPDQPEADAEKGSAKAKPRRKTLADEVPLFKVILLGDEAYVEAHVVTQIQKTCQLDKGEASRIFQEAQSTGSSVICVVCEEHAEFYAQQLKRQDIFVVVEKDE